MRGSPRHVHPGADPVVKFTRETGLKPYLAALGGEGSETALQFEVAYAQLCREAYPCEGDGHTLFPFTRLFVVARK